MGKKTRKKMKALEKERAKIRKIVSGKGEREMCGGKNEKGKPGREEIRCRRAANEGRWNERK